MSVSVGQKLRLTITDLAFGGEGVGRVEDFVLFVPFVLVGEDVTVEVTELKKRFGRARLIAVEQASPARAKPKCEYFGECGGCQYQHMDYSTQLEVKHKQITDLFQRVGGLDPKVVEKVIPCPQPYGYRNRIMIRSQWDKVKQGLNIGFIRFDNRLVVDINHCEIAEPGLNSEIERVRKNPPPKGGIKVVLRIPPQGWDVHPDSFFQNNFHLLPELTNTVRARLRDSGSKFLADVYCGVGFFALELADLVERFVGIELDQRAIKSARRNAEARSKINGEFLDGRAEDLLPEVISKFEPSLTTAILDPPRTGCPLDLLELLRRVRPAQILYVSCHPATLARDLSLLEANSCYRVVQVTPLDMFPQTQHVECVADLRVVSSASLV